MAGLTLVVPTTVAVTSAVSAQADDSTTISKAVTWAENLLGQHVYDGLCLPFVRDAYQVGAGVSIDGAGYANPIAYWNGHTNAQVTDDSTPPEGALVIWGANPYTADGHIALSLGAGTVISSAERGNNNIHEFTIADRNKTYASSYLGWMMPPGVLAQSGAAGGGAPTYHYQAFGGDFNGDGYADIGLRDVTTGVFYARYGSTFGSQDVFQWDNSVPDYQAFEGDFNGNHHVDVGLRNPHTGMFYVRYGPGFTAQDTVPWHNSVPDYQAFEGDFNGDGHADIALRNPHSGAFYIRFGPGFTTQTTFQWDNSTDYQAFVGDFNGDHHVDVGLRNPHSGVFYIRFGPGFTTQTTFQWAAG